MEEKREGERRFKEASVFDGRSRHFDPDLPLLQREREGTTRLVVLPDHPSPPLDLEDTQRNVQTPPDTTLVGSTMTLIPLRFPPQVRHAPPSGARDRLVFDLRDAPSSPHQGGRTSSSSSDLSPGTNCAPPLSTPVRPGPRPGR